MGNNFFMLKILNYADLMEFPATLFRKELKFSVQVIIWAICGET